MAKDESKFGKKLDLLYRYRSDQAPQYGPIINDASLIATGVVSANTPGNYRKRGVGRASTVAKIAAIFAIPARWLEEEVSFDRFQTLVASGQPDGEAAPSWTVPLRRTHETSLTVARDTRPHRNWRVSAGKDFGLTLFGPAEAPPPAASAMDRVTADEPCCLRLSLQNWSFRERSPGGAPTLTADGRVHAIWLVAGPDKRVRIANPVDAEGCLAPYVFHGRSTVLPTIGTPVLKFHHGDEGIWLMTAVLTSLDLGPDGDLGHLMLELGRWARGGFNPAGLAPQRLSQWAHKAQAEGRADFAQGYCNVAAASARARGV